MKRIIIISLLLLSITTNFAMAELTKEDLKEIEALLDKQEKRIKEYIDEKIGTVNVRIGTVNARIDAVEKTVNSGINSLEKTVNSGIDSLEKTVNSRIDAVERGQEFLKWMIGILALVVVAGIAFPPIWQEWRERRASSLTRRVAKLEQEVADLKKRKIYQ